MDFPEIGDREAAVYIDAEVTAQNRLLPRLRWELEQVMTRVKPADLSAAEIGALLIVLRLAHARVIGGPTGRSELRIVGGQREQPLR